MSNHEETDETNAKETSNQPEPQMSADMFEVVSNLKTISENQRRLAEMVAALPHRDRDSKIRVDAQIPEHILPGGSEKGAKSGPGWVGDINGLWRTNFFNGRYMTAEVLERDQVYHETRARMAAQTQHAGIAWGLGLAPMDGADNGAEAWHRPIKGIYLEKAQKRKVEERWPRWSSDRKLLLKPGLAFDGQGRPISVAREFRFELRDLLADYNERPTVAVPSTTTFAPCVCLEDLPPGTRDSGAAYEAGPYLLVIAPGEQHRGEARVHREFCGSNQTEHCEADGIRGRFSLSLVKFPLQASALPDVETSFELRGWLSAYYFDAWEHDLEERWQPPFPRGNEFCEGLGPFQREPGTVPLAMVYVDSSGDILFVDPWIPRRYQIESASNAWAARMRGAPAPASASARSHQFQCQLDEALGWFEGNWYGEQTRGRAFDRPHRNLYQMGFRHIPPYGFLPVGTPPDWQDFIESSTDYRVFDRRYLATEALVVREMSNRAMSYFEGTNVLPVVRVALHDDDILEDMRDAMDKDPISLEPMGRTAWDCLLDVLDPLDSLVGSSYGHDKIRPAALKDVGAHAEAARVEPLVDARRDGQRIKDDHKRGYEKPKSGLARLLSCFVEGERITLEKIINRELEVVEIIVPMEGKRRRRPLSSGADASGSFRDFARFMRDRGVDLPNGDNDRLREVYEDFLGESAEPHSFVFYVKRRMVLHEYLYIWLDFILDLIDVIAVFLEEWQPQKTPQTKAAVEARLRKDVAKETAESRYRPKYHDAYDKTHFTTVTLVNSFSTVPKRNLREGARLDSQQLRHMIHRAGPTGFDIVSQVASQPAAIATLAELARRYDPSMQMRATIEVYREKRQNQLENLVEKEVPRKQAEQIATDSAIEYMLRHRRGFAISKALNILTSRQAVDQFHDRLYRVGREDKAPLGNRVFLDKYDKVVRDENSEKHFENIYTLFGNQPVGEVLEDSDDARLDKIELESVLSRDTDGIREVVGDVDVDSLERRVVRRGNRLMESVELLRDADDAVKSRDFWTLYDTRVAEKDGDEYEALKSLEDSSDLDEPKHKVVNALKTVHNVLGGERYREFVDVTRVNGDSDGA